MVDLAVQQGDRAPLLPTVFDDLSQLARLPTDCARWPLDQAHSAGGTHASLQDLQHSLRRAATHGPWEWPRRPLVFVSDPHADAEGFLRSLVAAGTIRRRGPGTQDFELTDFGRGCEIIIGGDCLDKGPSNLDLLDAIAALYDAGADLHLLAGNHDLRLVVALAALRNPRDPLAGHLFVRMARKAVPLFREICERYDVFDTDTPIPDKAECRARLYPGADWAAQFPKAAAPYLSSDAIDSECRKLRAKMAGFDAEIARSGLTLRQVYAAATYCERLFFAPDGAYRWFYDRMDVLKRSGSILFIHAGLCDALCDVVSRGDWERVNAGFLNDARRAPFAFYFGKIANLVRTKYRATDGALTDAGVMNLHRAGVKMVVQGHVNNHAGQRLLAKRGLLHLEGDVTLDRASRSLEGLSGIGVGATLIYPTGDVVGLSADFPKAKLFQPDNIRWENA
ncbi:metallophosphoesterase family protein [Microbulbifer sp. S227A]|uniref:metallophosphoesterase family protein n=1 Tax=Microbulbifer sp. S227A TaxID=3415131 RepID=UPI003C79DD88